MMRRYLYPLLITLLWTGISVRPAPAQDLPSIEEKTDSLTKKDGFFPVYWDEASGKVWLEITRMNEDVLYVKSLAAGLGSNDVGLDRGRLGGEQVVRFERVGPKVLLVIPNLGYRAVSDNQAERIAVRDAFAPGVAWGFEVGAVSEDRVLVDATDFIVRDALGITRQLQDADQGSFRVDAQRSAPYPDGLKSFPRNTELEATLTFVTDQPGRYVRDVAADPYAVTLRVRQSLIELPDLEGYTPRPADPRSGAGVLTYVDYATPISEPKEKQFTVRHRLHKKDPGAAVSEAVEPIVYYLDPGTPEPVRSALLDGARWWNEAFEAAGYENAFQVEMLPDDADMLDVRYNVIQWIHRSTRGWSYGSSVVDPRTGEILKGHVSLGSLRVRQDYLIAEGLLAPYEGEDASGLSPEDDPMLDMALARLRQLSAHEVGHTLGFRHSYASSANSRASVMDYPAPLVEVRNDGTISLANAYDTGIGEWDKVAVRYSYSDFPEGTDEKAALDAILDEAQAEGLEFLTDSDARPDGGAHPRAHLWDNGNDVLAALDLDMRVREVALSQFGEANVRTGQPLATLEEVLVPLYLRHRYQVEAAVKLVGGRDYSYTLRGDDRPLPEPVSSEMQLAAVDALLDTVTPEALRLPASVRTHLPPRPPGYPAHRELFDGYTGLVFDPYAPAEVATEMVFGLLVHPERTARLVYQEDFDTSLPGYEDVLDRVFRQVWEASVPAEPYDAELQRLAQQVWTDALLDLATTDKVAAPVRARTFQHLRELRAWLESNPGQDPETIAHRAMVVDDLQRVLNRSLDAMETRQMSTLPPGDPIGENAPDYLQRRARRTAALDRWDHALNGCDVR